MMSNRPDIKIEKDRLDRIIYFVTLSLLLLLFAFNLWVYTDSPKIIPAHFDGAGNVNRYDDKAILLILPAVALLLFLFLNMLVRYPQIYNYPQAITEENAPYYYRQGTKMIRFLNLGIMLLFPAIEIEMYIGIKNKFLPFHWWQFILVLLVTIALPVLMALKFYPAKSKK